ncbi:MAG TPA: polysaccharide biosynthesis C-terminal domain-containing protein [Candidatus Dormibacteraeota bacterium]|nr:polysaccharide biosynthesis C-terminal domain-containing protein [Candidatus Dormibacteraeota bacterium]
MAEPAQVTGRRSLLDVGHGFRIRNAAIYVVSNGLQRGATVIVAPVLLYRLTVSDYGVYALLLTIYTLGPAILSLGLYGAIARFYFDTPVRQSRQQTMSALVIAHAVTVIVVTGAIDLALSLSVDSIAGIPYVYFRLTLWAAAASALYEGSAAFWRAAERPLAVAVAGIASVCATSAAMTGLLYLTPLGLKGVLIGLGAGQGLVSLCMLTLVLREIGLTWNLPLLRAALAFSLPLIPHFVSGWLLRAADRWILDANRNTADVGAYFLAAQLTSLISLVMFSTNDAIAPRFLARFRDDGPAGAQAFHARILPLYLGCSAALAAGAIVVGPEAAAIVSHGKITHISLQVSILACGFVASTLYVPFANAFFALKTTNRLFVLTMASAIVSICLNLLLIPPLGSVGAAVALLGAYMLLLGLAIFFAHRMLGLRTFLPLIGATALSLAALTWAAQAWIYR